MPDVRLLHYFEPTQWRSVSGLDDGKRKTKRGWSPGDSLNLVRVLSVRVNYSQQCRNDINGRWEYSKSIITVLRLFPHHLGATKLMAFSWYCWHTGDNAVWNHVNKMDYAPFIAQGWIIQNGRDDTAAVGRGVGPRGPHDDHELGPHSGCLLAFTCHEDQVADTLVCKGGI